MIGAEYFGWFVSGALFYQSNKHGHRSDKHSAYAVFALAIAVGILSAFTSGLWQPDKVVSQTYLVGCVAVFAFSQKMRCVQRFLAFKPLLFLGFVSYPLYLLHNELGIGLIAAMGEVTPKAFTYVVPIPVIAALLAASYAVAKHIEPWMH